MNMIRYRANRDLFDDFWNLHKELDRAFSQADAPRGIAQDFSPQMDVQEKNGHLLMSFDLPGVDKNDIYINIEDNVLTISGERKSETETETDGEDYYTKERTYGKFQRSFTLPSSIDRDQVEAHYENGVLQIAIPKKQEAQGRRIKVGEGKPNFFKKILGGKDEKQAKAS